MSIYTGKRVYQQTQQCDGARGARTCCRTTDWKQARLCACLHYQNSTTLHTCVCGERMCSRYACNRGLSAVIALFSTRDPREPVSLRPSETLYVRLPADTETSDTETAEDVAESEKAASKQAASEAAKSEVEVEHKDKDKLDETEQPKKTEQTKSEHKQLRRRRAHSAWTPLRLVAHHSYVVGMRVSGIVHRAIVRLEYDK